MLRFSRVVAIPLAPVLILQGRQLRRTIPRLPDAALPWTGELASPRPVRLLVLGDSTAAGVGVATQADALPGNLARVINEHYGRGTVWAAVGRNRQGSADRTSGRGDESRVRPDLRHHRRQ